MDRLKETLNWLESVQKDYDDNSLDYFVLRDAIKFLRAGAEMRKSKGIWEMEDACEAWDAVLKEDE